VDFLTSALGNELCGALQASLSLQNVGVLRQWASLYSSLPPRVLRFNSNKENGPLASVVASAVKAPIVDVFCGSVDVGNGCVVCGGLNEHWLGIQNGWERIVTKGQFPIKSRCKLSPNGEVDVLRVTDLRDERNANAKSQDSATKKVHEIGE
jgi:hypothetical protein